MWLLNVRERKLSGGGSTRRGFVIGLRFVDYCSSLSMSGFYVTSPRLSFTRSWNDKTEIEKFMENCENYSKIFAQFCSVSNKEYLEQNIGFMSNSELKYATLLNHSTPTGSHLFFIHLALIRSVFNNYSSNPNGL